MLESIVETLSKLRFSGFKKFVTSSVLGSSNSRRYHSVLKLLVATYKSDVWEQNCAWLFYYFNFERSYDVFPERRRKWKFPHIVLERRTLCFSSFKNRKLKVNLWWVGARERKKRASFVPFIFPEGNCFKICVLSQCIVY